MLSAERIYGAAAALLGLVLLVWIIPAQTDDVGSGMLSPASFPSFAAVVVLVSGIALAVMSAPSTHLRLVNFLRVVGVTALTGLAVLAMLWWGYLVSAPILTFVLMWICGERRPLWLTFGSILCPLIIWAIFVPGLGRVLP